MSFSVDDLVASLSGNHIGQEATDIAALQVPFISRPSSRVCGGTNPQFTLSLSSLSPSTAPSRRQLQSLTNPVIVIPLSPRHHLHHICNGQRGERAILVTRSWATGAEVPVSLPTLAGPGKIALMRQISTTLSSEIAIWMIWKRMSGWWKSYSFPLLPPPNLLVDTLTSERMVIRVILRVPRWRLRRPCIPTVTSQPRTLSTLHSCSNCNSNKLRIHSRPLPRSLVNSESRPNNRPSLRHHNITTTLINSLAPMTSINTGVDISDLLWSLHSMGNFRTFLPWWIADCEPDR